MIKVCHLTSAHNRYDGRIFDRDCKSLAKNGYEVYLIVNDNKNNEIIENVNIISTNYIAKNRIDRMLYSTKEIYKKALEINADIYHLHDPELLLIANKLKRKGKKVIFDSHECYNMQIRNKYYIPKVLRIPISKIYESYETNVCKKIDAVITPGTWDGKNMFLDRCKNVEVIDNVPNICSEIIRSNTVKEDTVCYVGSISHERGISQLVKACYNAKIKLILAGNFVNDKYKDTLINMPEYSIVDYRGVVTKNEVYNIYSKCLIGACTLLNVGQYNKSDNLPTKVYEYMAAKLPVILSESKHANCMLSQYKFGVTINPDSVEDITNKILYLVQNKNIAEEMGQNGYKAYCDKFNWSIEEKKLFNLYKKII